MVWFLHEVLRPFGAVLTVVALAFAGPRPGFADDLSAGAVFAMRGATFGCLNRQAMAEVTALPAGPERDAFLRVRFAQRACFPVSTRSRWETIADGGPIVLMRLVPPKAGLAPLWLARADLLVAPVAESSVPVPASLSAPSQPSTSRQSLPAAARPASRGRVVGSPPAIVASSVSSADSPASGARGRYFPFYVSIGIGVIALLLGVRIWRRWMVPGLFAVRARPAFIVVATVLTLAAALAP